MDPQKLSQLDPKLREAYQRVMGTPIPQPQAPLPAEALAKAGAQTPQPPVPEPQPESIPTPPQQQEPFFIPQPETNPPISEPAAPAQQTSTNFTQMNSEVPASSQNFTVPPAMTQTITVKKKSGIIVPILFGIVGLAFLVIYTLFWTKIFNFRLPFLP